MSTKATIEFLVTRAFGWLVEHLEEFDPFKNGRPFEMRNGQRIGELAILLHAYTELNGNRSAPGCQRIIDLLRKVQQQRWFGDRLFRSPQEFVLFSEVYAGLRGVGYDNAVARQMIQRAIDAGYLNFTERLPHRVMDIASCLERGGFRHPLPSLQSLYSTSVMSEVPCPAMLNEDALYFLTHVLMFLHDFGVGNKNAVPAAQREELRHCLSALLVIVCQDHHWDLLAELLLCWECCGLGNTYVHESAWKELMAAQRKDGAIPGPEWALRLHSKVEDNLDPNMEGDFYFAHHYHTTLVSIIVGSLRLKRLKAGKNLAAPKPEGRTPYRRSLLNRSFSRKQIPAAIESSKAWLAGLLNESEDHGQELSSKLLCQILLANWICCMASRNDYDFFQVARRIGHRLLQIEKQADLASANISPGLKLMTASLLNEVKIHLPSLHCEDGFVAASARILGNHRSEDAIADLAYYDKRLLLRRLGLHPRPLQINHRQLIKAFRSFFSCRSA